MALTKVSGHIIDQPFDVGIITATNQYVSGIGTFGNIRVLGDLQIDGTTTTLDTVVTEVDRLEVGANNSTVGVAITQSGTGDIFNLYDGSSEVFSVADGGNVSIIDKIVHTGDTNTAIRFPAADTVTVETGGSERVRITSAGSVGIGLTNPEDYGNYADDFVIYNASQPGMTLASGTSGYGSIYFADGTVGNTLSRGQIQYGHSDDYMAFATAATERLRITSTGKLEAYKGTSTTGKTSGSEAFTVGNGAGNHRFAVYPDGTTVIGGTGLIGNYNILLQNDGVGVFDNQLLIGLTTGVGVGGVPADLNSTEVGRGFINISRDDTAAADHILFGKNGSIAASMGTDTTNTLVFKTGTTERLRITSDGKVRVPDNGKFIAGAGDDLQIYHDGTDTWIDNDEGDLYIRNTGDDIIIRAADDVLIQTQASEGAITARGDGQVELYHNNNIKLETTTTGAKVTGALEVTQEYPSIRPTLDLNFAATKTLDRRITFTRDSIGTYYGSDGLIKYASDNEPRFDHDPNTRESLGLLVEQTKTNLVLYSNSGAGLNNPPYYGNWNAAPYTDNFAVAPDGTTTAWKMTPTTPSSSRVARVSVTAGNTYTFSVWLKKDPSVSVTDGVWDYLGYLIAWSQNGSTVTSATTQVLVAGSSASQELTTEWRRFSVSYTAPANMTSMEFGLSNRNSGSGNPGYSVFVWGAQVEEGSFATSYIPTSGSTVTRGADNAKITGTNFTDFYNSTEGTLFTEHMGAGNGSVSPYVAMLSDGTNNERTIIMSDYTGYQVVVKEGNANQAILDGGTPILNAKNKNATAIKKDDFALSLNGGTVATDTSGNMSVVDQLWIGSRNGADSYMNNTIQSIKYYNKRLPNAQLQGLTQQ